MHGSAQKNANGGGGVVPEQGIWYNADRNFCRGGNRHADAGRHIAVLCRRRFRGGAAALVRVDLVGGNRLRSNGAGGGAAAPPSAGPAAAAGGGDSVLPLRRTAVFRRVSGPGPAAGAGALRPGGGIFRRCGGLRPADGAGRPGDGVSGGAPGRQGGLLRRPGAGPIGAGTADHRLRPLAGRRAHPRKRRDHLHLPGRVRPAVCPGGRDGGCGQRREPAVAAPADGPGPAGKDRRHLGR